MCLFRSLPSSFDNVVDNLSTKDNLTYEDAHSHLLDILKKKELQKSESKAYFTANDTKKGTLRESSVPECSWCRKRGFNFKGHTHRNCYKIASDKKKSKAKGKEKEKEKNKDSANAAKFTFNDSDEESADFGKAFAVSTSHSPTHWILDSGCTTHMTSRKDLLTSLLNKK
ncbi:hypothetical protein K3495_g16637 [Podosphaera aphanis]|nr:hypothetical protein K3495_g16637 [Podosphaera aphanis]